MYSSHGASLLLTLSVALSGVQGHHPHRRHHHSSGASLVCHEDNQLRALERFSNYADEFCPEFLAKTGRYPRWLDHWNKKSVSSACSCYEKTAASHGASTTAPTTGTLSMSSTAPVEISEVFATTSASGGYFPSVAGSSSLYFPTVTGSGSGIFPSGSASGGYFPSGSVFGSSGSIPSMTGSAPMVASPTSSSNATIAGTPLPSTAVVSTSAAATAPATNPSSTISEGASAVGTSIVPYSTNSLPAGDVYPPQPPGAGPGKRGLVYDNKSQDDWSALFKFSQYVTYGSNWGVDRSTQLDESFSYVPTIAVDAHLNNDDWNSTVPVLIEGGTKALFASNEPDNTSQANLTPEQAATVYKKYMMPYVGTVQLGTPAVTNGGGQTGLTFLENFMTYCTGCRFNFINVHHYLQRSDVNTTQYIQNLKDYIDIDVPEMQQRYPQLNDLPIFLGEWWLWNASLDEGSELMDELLPYLDNNPRVLAYQAFGGLWEGNFISSDLTTLTPAGQKYSTWASTSTS